ncbi:MAG: hypothetical protein M3P29_12430, partial [Acidobacteriota bacterium]|nr:hypothetical protein [Acidobacteriota bacterium]
MQTLDEVLPQRRDHRNSGDLAFRAPSSLGRDRHRLQPHRACCLSDGQVALDIPSRSSIRTSASGMLSAVVMAPWFGRMAIGFAPSAFA